MKPEPRKKLGHAQKRHVHYSVKLRDDNQWYVVETSFYNEIWRGPFPTEAAAHKRLEQYGQGYKPPKPEYLDN
jgi:hypothetical protein